MGVHRRPSVALSALSDWWVELMSMTLHVVEFPPHSPSFERIVDGQWQTVEQSSFRAMAVVVDGRMGQPAHQ